MIDFDVFQDDDDDDDHDDDDKAEGRGGSSAHIHETNLTPLRLEVKLSLLLSLRPLSAFPQVRIVVVFPVSCLFVMFCFGGGGGVDDDGGGGGNKGENRVYMCTPMLLCRGGGGLMIQVLFCMYYAPLQYNISFFLKAELNCFVEP